MENSITFHHHHNKIKFGVVSVIALVLIYLGFTSVTSYFSYYGNGQCRDVFDNQPLENRQKICCNMDHYNSSDSLCKVKCDAIDVNPESAFCQNLKKNQAQSPVAKEIEKAVPLPKESPKCSELNVVNYNKNETSNLLKPSNPLNFEMSVYAKDIQPSYFIYEFYTIEGNDIYSIKPISFERGKNLMAVNPAKPSSNGDYKDSMTALHNFFFKENLNDNNKIPKDVLVVTSIIDQRGNKQLQPSACFARFSVDPTPSYCKSFKLSSDTLNSDKNITLSIESKSPTTYSYYFKILNLNNYTTSDGDKNYKPVSFDYVNGKNEDFVISKLANGDSKLNFNLAWTDFYQKDLNFNNKYPKNIRIEAYVKPYEKATLEELVPCTVDFKLEGDQGLDICKDISISGGTKNVDGISVIKPGDYLTIKSESKTKDITQFTYTFHNLDNLDSNKVDNGVKDASEIYFTKSDPFEIIKNTAKTDSKSILVSYDDLNKIDLSTGSKPKNIQVRALFSNSDGRDSKLDSKCVSTFKIE